MSTLIREPEKITVKLTGGDGGTTVVKEKSSILVNKNGNIIVNPMTPQVEIPADINEKALTFMDSYYRYLQARTDAYIERSANGNGELQQEAGEPVYLGYQFWNALTVGPIQFTWNPPYRPSKIIAAGELTLMLGVVWINPAPFGPFSGRIILGGRNYRTRFETINLSNVSNGPSAMFTGHFSAPAPTINFFPWWFIPGDPGQNPDLYETTLTADITDPAQPFAAFSTWHQDLDVEPGFLGRPTRWPEWQYDVPAKFMVYRK